jgi:hypothetical protein
MFETARQIHAGGKELQTALKFSGSAQNWY